jgi:taurine dioxygenase
MNAPLRQTPAPQQAQLVAATEIARDAGIEVIRVEANLGAEIRGLDIASVLTDLEGDLLRELLWEHQVLFFRDSHLDDESQARLGRLFGPPVADSIAARRGVKAEDVQPFNTGPAFNAYYGTKWHADATYLETPYSVSILRSVVAPELGGDTAFSSGIAAYESLPQGLRERIEGLDALHRPNSKAYKLIEDKDALADYLSDYPGVAHPVVISHPHSKRKVLYVNETFTSEIIGLPEDESRELLDRLTSQFYRPENIVRFKWRPGSVAIWDNRAVQHYGVADYGEAPRQLVRVVAAGDRPTR